MRSFEWQLPGRWGLKRCRPIEIGQGAAVHSSGVEQQLTRKLDTPSELRITERRITERRITERRITERRITERRITEHRKLPNVEYYPTSNISQRWILQNIL